MSLYFDDQFSYIFVNFHVRQQMQLDDVGNH